MTGHDTPRRVYVGCAGWSLARAALPDFPSDGSHLARYSAVFRGVEVNSSFHRAHRTSTYARWAASVPDSFRFSVKAPKAITHQKRLVGAEDLLAKFLGEAGGLGEKLGCILVQLPPSLEFDPATTETFFSAMRGAYAGHVVVEPRHRSWFGGEANKLLRTLSVSRVAADPALVMAASEPGGAPALVYFRLHGSPQLYYSSYTKSYLDGLAFRLRAYARSGASIWCVFDNTIRGHATENALYLTRKIVLEERGANVA